MFDLKAEEPEKKVLMLGLDGAGKSSLLASLGKQDPTAQMQPTEGFNVMCVQTESVSLNIWESKYEGRCDHWHTPPPPLFFKDIFCLPS